MSLPPSPPSRARLAQLVHAVESIKARQISDPEFDREQMNRIVDAELDRLAAEQRRAEANDVVSVALYQQALKANDRLSKEGAELRRVIRQGERRFRVAVGIAAVWGIAAVATWLRLAGVI